MKKIFVSIILLISLIQTQVIANTVTSDNLFIDSDDTLYRLELDEKYSVIKKEKMMENVQFIDNYYYAVKNDGTLWSWWQDTEDGIEMTNNPVKIMDNVRLVSGSASHTLIVKNDNTLWGFGTNDCGQLGERAPQRIPESKAVKLMNNVKKAVAGDFHSLILKTDGSVLSLGSNDYGALGVGNHIKYSSEPLKIMEKVKDVFVGPEVSFAIDEDNTLWYWGSIFGDYLGGNSSDKDYYPQKCTDNVKAVSSHDGFNLILKTDNTVWIYGRNEYESEARGIKTPKKIADNINSIDDWGRDDKAFLVANDGELYIFDLVKNNDNRDYILKNIAKDVKTSEDVIYSPIKKFYDMLNKPQEMKKAALALSQAGIVEGTSDKNFEPDKALTRAELAAMLLRVSAKEDGGNTDSGFADVTRDKWYYDTAGASKKCGIISGFEDNTFRGDEPVSKLQTITLTARVLRQEKELKEDTEYIYNRDEIPYWAKSDIEIAIANELIDTEKDLINVNEIMTRGEAAVMLYKLYNMI